MELIRRSLFETNSSSTHSITITSTTMDFDSSLLPNKYGELYLEFYSFENVKVNLESAYLKACYLLSYSCYRSKVLQILNSVLCPKHIYIIDPLNKDVIKVLDQNDPVLRSKKKIKNIHKQYDYSGTLSGELDDDIILDSAFIFNKNIKVHTEYENSIVARASEVFDTIGSPSDLKYIISMSGTRSFLFGDTVSQLLKNGGIDSYLFFSQYNFHSSYSYYVGVSYKYDLFVFMAPPRKKKNYDKDYISLYRMLTNRFISSQSSETIINKVIEEKGFDYFTKVIPFEKAPIVPSDIPNLRFPYI